MTTSSRFRKIFGPLPGTREARFISVVAILVGIFLCGMSLYRGSRGEKFMGRWVGGDFIMFYSVGKVFNENEPAKVYDVEFLNKIMHTVMPLMDQGEMLPMMHGPYLPLVFRPFAKLSYQWAYVAWLIFSVVLYVISLFLLRPPGMSDADAKTGFLLAISSPVFLLETWIGGQISILAFFVFALFFWLRRQHYLVASGFVLAFVAYKPTLLIFPAAMLLIGRAWRTLSGLAAGLTAVVLLSLAAVGVAGFNGWFTALRIARALAEHSTDMLRSTKYMHVNAFFQMLVGANMLAFVLAAATMICGIAYLVLWWWLASKKSQLELLWPTTFACSLVLNLYVPIYDTIHLAIAAALAYSTIRTYSDESAEVYQWWIVLLYIVPWISQAAAELVHVQLLTIVIAGFGWWLARTPLTSALPRADYSASARAHLPAAL